MENVVVISPHIDDAEFGMGATISRLIDNGVRVTNVVFSLCFHSLGVDTWDECTNAADVMGCDLKIYDYHVRQFSERRQHILQKLIDLNNEVKPDTVFMPSHNDIHQDHSVIHAESLRAFKHCNVYGYELPWNNYRDAPNTFNVVEYCDIDIKIKALSEYKSQTHRKYSDTKFLESLARVRGLQSGVEFAEAFYQYRQIWK